MAISMDKQYRTRSGAEVRVLATDAEGQYPVVAIVKGREGVQVYSYGGAYYAAGEPDELGLVEVPPETLRRRCVHDGAGGLADIEFVFRGRELVSATRVG